jgi:hypothetical protein
VNVVLNGERSKAFPRRSKTRQDCQLPLLFNRSLGVLAFFQRRKSSRKSSMSFPIGREENSLFTNAGIFKVEVPTDSQKKSILGLISEFS